MNKSWSRAGLALCALLAVTALCAHSLTVKECEIDSLQLPKRVRPTHYKLDIKVNPEEPDFSGRVEIDLRHSSDKDDVLCSQSKDRHGQVDACNRAKIFLNADKSLDIKDVTYQELENGLAIPVSSVCRSSDREMIIIELSREPGESSSGKLKLGFAGDVRNDFNGLFRAEYQDTRTNSDKLIAVTQFQSGHARKVLPCFDEPDFKATFELSVEHPANKIALANTRPLRQEQTRHEEDAKEYTRTYFKTTPKMSSYLLAFAVGEFERIETSVANTNLTLGIYTPPGRSEEARSSLAVASKAYVALRDFFDLDQPVDKIDFVSCKEFPGAMENWGMITIEEYSVLPDLENFEALNMHYSIVTIIHEMAHQWFGNLVTPKWWDDLWLNEGFASWISNQLADQLYPESEAKYMYLIKDMRTALMMDANPKRTHPIKNSQLQTMEEIENSFDAIAYQKSDAVIRMLCDYVGLEQFKKGLRAYIRENQFGNTDDSDLWRALSATSDLDVEKLMQSWIKQAGFPLIFVKLSDDTKRLQMHQMRFPSESISDDEEASWRKQTWVVPITLVVSNSAGKQQKIKFVLNEQRDEIKLPSWFDISKPGHWLKLNSDYQGFYRVHYADPLLKALRAPIETKSMSAADRLNLFERVSLLDVGMTDESELVEMLTWFKNEDNGAVVVLICKAIEYLRIDLESDKHNLYSILINYYEKNGRLSDAVEESNSASLVTKFARADVLTRLIDVNYEPAIKDSLRLFEQTEDGNVPVFIRPQVFAAVGKAGSDEQFQQVIEFIRNISSQRIQKSTVRNLDVSLYYHHERRNELKKNFSSLLD